jgi:hypothetical protein
VSRRLAEVRLRRCMCTAAPAVLMPHHSRTTVGSVAARCVAAAVGGVQAEASKSVPLEVKAGVKHREGE